MTIKCLKWMSLGMLVGIFTLTAFGTTSQAAEPIKIGCTISQSGRYADSGSYYKEAYLMWEEDVNAKGGLLGRPVKLVIYDDESSADKAVGLYERLISVDKVVLLLGPYTSPGLGTELLSSRHLILDRVRQHTFGPEPD